MSQDAHLEIVRFDLAYNAVEDRLALDGAGADGETARLWLTRRLCANLVRALAPVIAPPPAGDGAPRAGGDREAAQTRAQAAAVSGLGRTPAVGIDRAVRGALVVGVRMTPRDGRLDIELVTPGGRAWRIPATVLAVRQFLAVLHLRHAEAGWTTDDWPLWIAEPMRRAPGAPVH